MARSAPPHRRVPRNRPMAAGRVLVVGALAFFLAALLNARTLAAMAEGRPFGWQRDVAVGAVRPLTWLSRVTFLDRPGAWFDGWKRRDDAVEVAPPPPTTAVAVTTSAPGRRVATVERPLRIWVGGDSIARDLGYSLQRRYAGSGVVELSIDGRIATGLARPDYFDWPGHLAAVQRREQPEVFVVMFGGNDGQSLEIDGVVRQMTEPEWQAEYASRVGALMDQLTAGGASVVWVGQPVARSASFTRKMTLLDGIYAAEAAKRPGRVRYLDTLPLFVDADGQYAAFLPDARGELRPMRQGDGYHLTVDGAARLADAVEEVLRELVDLPGAGDDVTASGPGR